MTVRWSDGTACRVALGALPRGHLAQRCMAVLLEVLPGPLWHHLYSAFVSHSGERPGSFHGRLLPVVLELECHASHSLVLLHLQFAASLPVKQMLVADGSLSVEQGGSLHSATSFAALAAALCECLGIAPVATDTATLSTAGPAPQFCGPP